MQPATLNVFISSTWLDLRPEREAVEAVLQRLREMKFVGMEYFGSREDAPKEASLGEVDRCQLYIGIFGNRYGSGITEAEYRRARERGMPCLIYNQVESVAKPEWNETDVNKASRLKALKEELSGEYVVSEFSSPHDLAARLTADLHRWLIDTVYMPAVKETARRDYPLPQLDSLLRDVRALGERSVAIGGDNTGTVITGDVHTGDVVLQILSEAPLMLAQHLRVDQFRTLIEERTRGFVGRDFIFKAIDDHLSGNSDPQFRSGYIVVHGEPGIGKTALAGELVKRLGYVHHFNIATQNIRSARDFLGNICTQLILRYKLDHPTLPPAAAQDSGFFSQLLSEAVAKTHDLPLVIVVDALDEAEDTDLGPNANRLFLPSILPEDVFMIVTTREKQEYRLSVDRRKKIYIKDTSEQNLADVRNYVHNFVDEFHDIMAARMAAWQIQESTFVDVVTDKSQGNFMYLVHVLRDIKEGKLMLQHLDSVYDLPQGLQEYYQRHWRTMRSQDPVKFQDYYEPVICILGSAREPVPISQLVEWTRRKWPHLSGDRIRDVIRLWREFLNEDQSQHEAPVYRIYHTSFQDFLKEEVGLAGYHEEIALTALNKIPGFLDAKLH